MYTHAHTHSHSHTHAHTHSHSLSHTHTHKHTHTHTHTHTHMGSRSPMIMRHGDVSGVMPGMHHTMDKLNGLHNMLIQYSLYGIYYIVISGGGAVSLEFFCKIPVGSKLKI